MPRTDSMDIKLYYTITKERKFLANAELERHMLDVFLLYNRLILNRISSRIDAILRKNQAGFRNIRSCIQQIYILRRIMDGDFSQNMPLFITFVDFQNPFDSIDRDMMFAI